MPSHSSTQQFHWPEGKRAALSLTFDDARPSQIDNGFPVLDAHNLKATFYVSVGPVEQRLTEWCDAVANGHEIGNHTLSHPCSGNFAFSRNNPLEEYTLERMENELRDANHAIEQLLGVKPTTFAYPCGNKFVGRGEAVKSYVPLVARHFRVGRNAFNEIHNDPVFTDLAQVTALDADGASFEHLKMLIDRAITGGGWLILLGHEVGAGGGQTVLTEALEAVCVYAQDVANGLWMDTVAAIGDYIIERRT